MFHNLLYRTFLRGITLTKSVFFFLSFLESRLLIFFNCRFYYSHQSRVFRLMKYFTTFFLLYFYKYEVQLSMSFSFLHFYVITLLRRTWLLMTRCCQNGRFKQKICLEKRLSCLAVSTNFSNFCVHIQILLSSNAWAIQFLFTCEHSKTCYEFVLLFKPFLSCSMNSNDLSFTNWLTVFRLFFFFPHSFLIHNVARARTLLSFPVTIFFFLWKLASDCSGSIYFRENTCKQINLFRFQVTWCVFLSHF